MILAFTKYIHLRAHPVVEAGRGRPAGGEWDWADIRARLRERRQAARGEDGDGQRSGRSGEGRQLHLH